MSPRRDFQVKARILPANGLHSVILEWLGSRACCCSQQLLGQHPRPCKRRALPFKLARWTFAPRLQCSHDRLFSIRTENSPLMMRELLHKRIMQNSHRLHDIYLDTRASGLCFLGILLRTSNLMRTQTILLSLHRHFQEIGG